MSTETWLCLLFVNNLLWIVVGAVACCKAYTVGLSDGRKPDPDEAARMRWAYDDVEEKVEP